MDHDRSSSAEDTAAILQQAVHDGRPVMIPGAFEVRVGLPRVQTAIAPVESPSHAAAAPVDNRAQLEREREGGGAPAERRQGRTIFSRFLHAL